MLIGYLVDEAGHTVCRGLAEEHTLSCAGNAQLFLCSCYRNIAKSAFLLHLVRLAYRLYPREDALLGADEEHICELKPLGRVHRHHDNAVLILVVVVHISVQRNIGKISLKRRLGRLALVVYDARFELLDIFGSCRVLNGVFLLQKTEISRFFEKLVIQEVGRKLLGLLDKLAYHVRKNAHPHACTAKLGVQVCVFNDLKK